MSTEGNKRAVRRYFEEFHTGRQLSIADEIISPASREPTLARTRELTSAFPDYRMSIVDQVAEGDKVATVWTAEGTHQGTWNSPLGPIPASGRRVTWSGTTTFGLVDGQIADVIGTNWDHLGILQCMGALPAISPRPGG